MRTPNLYLAQEDENGILLVERFGTNDGLSVDDAAEYANDYPDCIYFEVPPRPTVEDVKTALRENIEKVISEVASSLIMLGSNFEWSLEHNFAVTEGIAMLADRVGLPGAGDQSDDDLVFWRSLADRLGIDHDGEA